MSLRESKASLEEALALFTGPEHDPFDTSEAKATTAFNNEQMRSMAERLAAQRDADAGVQTGESQA